METQETRLKGLNGIGSQKIQKLKTREEIMKELDDQILIRISEAELLNKAKIALGEQPVEALIPSVSIAKKSLGRAYPGYPTGEPLLKKISFLEEIYLKMWNKTQMFQLIKDAEGDDQSKKTLLSFKQRLDVLVREGDIIKMKYHNSKRHCFYTTQSAWIEIVQIGDEFFHSVIPTHAPEPEFLGKLTHEKMDPSTTKWEGID